MCERYRKRGKFIQSWRRLGDPKEYRLIIDSLLNLPSLFKVSELTGKEKCYEIAENHLNQAIKGLIRDDYSTYHTCYFDPESGEPIYGETAQENRDESTWSRGQGWAIYGLILNNNYVKDDCIELYKGCLMYYLDRLPESGIAYWDFDFTDMNPSYRDSSSNSLVLCGMLEYKSQQSNKEYDDEIKEMFNNIYNNAANFDMNTDILLDHGMYSYVLKEGVDEGCAWGDYFYVEVLIRLKNTNWKKYW